MRGIPARPRSFARSNQVGFGVARNASRAKSPTRIDVCVGSRSSRSAQARRRGTDSGPAHSMPIRPLCRVEEFNLGSDSRSAGAAHQREGSPAPCRVPTRTPPTSSPPSTPCASQPSTSPDSSPRAPPQGAPPHLLHRRRHSTTRPRAGPDQGDLCGLRMAARPRRTPRPPGGGP